MKKILSIGLLVFISAACSHPEQKKEPVSHHKQRFTSPPLKTKWTYEQDAPADSSRHLVQVEDFDEHGYKVKLTHYADGKSIDYTITYVNDSKGNPVETKSTYADGSFMTEKNTYNDDSKLVSTEWKQSDGNYGKHEYTFDDKGKITRWMRYEKGALAEAYVYDNTYNYDGDLVETISKDVKGTDTAVTEHYKYAYDTLSRQTHKATMNEGIPVPMNLQEYYYDTSGNNIMEIHYTPDTADIAKLLPYERVVKIYNVYGEVEETRLLNTNGQVVTETRNIYDQYGHLLSTETNSADGTYKKTSWTYDYYEKK